MREWAAGKTLVGCFECVNRNNAQLDSKEDFGMSRNSEIRWDECPRVRRLGDAYNKLASKKMTSGRMLLAWICEGEWLGSFPSPNFHECQRSCHRD